MKIKKLCDEIEYAWCRIPDSARWWIELIAIIAAINFVFWLF